MAELVYVLCAATSVLCAGLLVRSFRRTRARVLLWSSLGFVGLALNNVLLVFDLVVFPAMNLFPLRTVALLLGLGTLLYGLIWETL
jgi:hypothetical protein